MNLMLLNMPPGQGEGFNILLLIGIATFCGTVGAGLFKRLRIPEVVGYVAIGLLLGPIFKIISHQTVEALEPFNLFALGIIGFLIGGELKREVFVKFGKQVTSILLFEGLTAFFLVGTLTFLVMWYFSNWEMGLAVGIVLGAICSATDPASTVSVLWEYKARGPLTTMLTAIVALDDALALILYAIGVSVAGIITGHQETGFIAALLTSFYEIFGSLLLGGGAGLILSWILKRTSDSDKSLVLSLSSTLLIIGLAIRLNLDVILSAMTMGLILTNVKSGKISSSFSLMRKFSVPIYVLFFVLVGARLRISNITTLIWWLVGAYVVGSVIGKTTGSYLGGLYSKSVKSIRQYLGFCLYPQGGIAVGLLIMASHKFDSEISSILLLVVVTGAFILQIIGPLGVKFGAGRAGELGLNVTEEDLIAECKVADVMDTEIPAIKAGMSLNEVIQIVGATESFYYSVVDSNNRLIGLMTLYGIKNTFTTRGLNDWLVALDIMEPVTTRILPETDLSEALDNMRKLNIDFAPVVESRENNKYLGIISSRKVHRQLSARVLAKQKEADTMYGQAT